MVTKTVAKVPCPICGKEVKVKGLGAHKSRAHPVLSVEAIETARQLLDDAPVPQEPMDEIDMVFVRHGIVTIEEQYALRLALSEAGLVKVSKKRLPEYISRFTMEYYEKQIRKAGWRPTEPLVKEK